MVKATVYHPATNKARSLRTDALQSRVDIFNNADLNQDQLINALAANDLNINACMHVLNTLNINKNADVRRVK